MEVKEEQIERIDIESFCRDNKPESGQYCIERNKGDNSVKLVIVNDIATSPGADHKDGVIERMSVSGFCDKYNVKTKDFAKAANTRPQQISIWKNPVERIGDDRQPEDSDMKVFGRYLVEFNKSTGEVRIVLAQQFVTSFNMALLGNK
jgi:hypothetical protein